MARRKQTCKRKTPPMTGFDVRRSRPARQRAILFLSSLSLALILISGVLIQRAPMNGPGCWNRPDPTAERGKPDPEVYLRAAEKLGVPPRRCLAVEDAPAGVEAARRAGVRVGGRRRFGTVGVAG
jgi:histidinol phosphatase-like enzyme